MTVKELKQQLSRFDDDCEIIWEGDYECYGYNAYNVKLRTVDEIVQFESDKKSKRSLKECSSIDNWNWTKQCFVDYINNNHFSNCSARFKDDYEKNRERAKKTIVLLSHYDQNSC